MSSAHEGKAVKRKHTYLRRLSDDWWHKPKRGKRKAAKTHQPDWCGVWKSTDSDTETEEACEKRRKESEAKGWRPATPKLPLSSDDEDTDVELISAPPPIKRKPAFKERSHDLSEGRAPKSLEEEFDEVAGVPKEVLEFETKSFMHEMGGHPTAPVGKKYPDSVASLNEELDKAKKELSILENKPTYVPQNIPKETIDDLKAELAAFKAGEPPIELPKKELEEVEELSEGEISDSDASTYDSMFDGHPEIRK